MPREHFWTFLGRLLGHVAGMLYHVKQATPIASSRSDSSSVVEAFWVYCSKGP